MNKYLIRFEDETSKVTANTRTRAIRKCHTYDRIVKRVVTSTAHGTRKHTYTLKNGDNVYTVYVTEYTA